MKNRLDLTKLKPNRDRFLLFGPLCRFDCILVIEVVVRYHSVTLLNLGQYAVTSHFGVIVEYHNLYLVQQHSASISVLYSANHICVFKTSLAWVCSVTDRQRVFVAVQHGMYVCSH